MVRTVIVARPGAERWYVMSRQQATNSPPSHDGHIRSTSLLRLFTSFAVWTLLALAVGTAALWARSYYESDVLNHTSADWGFDLRSGIGVIVLTFDAGHHWQPRSLFWLHDTYSYMRRRAWSHGAGFAGFNLATIVQFGTTYYQIKVPHWFLAMILALPAGLWFATNRSARKIKQQRGFAVLEKKDVSKKEER